MKTMARPSPTAATSAIMTMSCHPTIARAVVSEPLEKAVCRADTIRLEDPLTACVSASPAFRPAG